MDCRGLKFAIKKIGKAYKLPLPEYFTKLGFCQICLGANVPNQHSYPKGAWCCGAWCDEILPPWKICEGFKADRQKIKELVENIRPDEKEKTAVYSSG